MATTIETVGAYTLSRDIFGTYCIEYTAETNITMHVIDEHTITIEPTTSRMTADEFADFTTECIQAQRAANEFTTIIQDLETNQAKLDNIAANLETDGFIIDQDSPEIRVELRLAQARIWVKDSTICLEITEDNCTIEERRIDANKPGALSILGATLAPHA